ncbi:hypothetical protein K504DRAFT_460956 [Pleomassaria siparia CBS 279.74]|uniref:Lytic polysaccharide monooxygenase n=1 Tax=Pleomassaria siparia CBS 279.74 TaxID=1314801 RepID=A0A6G1JVP9_9PLEO|nr:hypothetical protein K504DRAFT_460956 [Pleomassaria siparia CBS 279.74]
MLSTTYLTLLFAATISAHTAVWAPGMYCRGGADPNVDDPNTNLAVNPLYQHTKEDWWFQHHRGCDAAPPAAGDFLSIPANGEFTVELAHNRAVTTLSYDGTQATDWPDGQQHPEDWDAGEGKCLEDGALHTRNESSQGATAWAISYQSDLKAVTMESLAVFSTKDHTPWKRLATYKVPDLRECAEEGCTCAWLWIPNGCGEPNMYMQGFKCKVTNASPTARPLAAAQVPTYCADDQSKCVQGAKQMLAWHQLEGNNIETPDGTTPTYNTKCGWAEGAQTDIFDITVAQVPTRPTPANTTITSFPGVPASTSS